VTAEPGSQDDAPREEAEERAKQYARDMEYLYRTALDLVAFPPDRDIYPYIAERLKELAGDHVVAVSSYDAGAGCIQCRAVVGLGKFAQGFLKLVGRDPVGMRFPISGEALEGLCKSRIARVPGGMTDLVLGQIPEPACKAMEKLLGIEAVHAIGVMNDGKLLGSAVVIQRKGSELRNRTVIETFLGQVSVALQHRASEEALRRSEAKYRAVVENTNDIVFAADAEGRITYVSHQIERFGLNPEDISSLDVFEDFVVPEDRERVLSDFQHTMATGEEFPTEFRARDKDGRVRWLEDLSKVRRDEAGRVVGLAGVLRDITERKEAEEALRESEKKYRELVENMSEVVYTLDGKGVVTYVSPAVEALIGFKPSEITGRPFSDFVHREELPHVSANIRSILSGDVRRTESRVLTRSGDVRWVRSSTRPIFEGGRIVGLGGILVDVTEQRLLENRILEASVNEQRRIGQELHDGLGQELAAISFMGGALEQKLAAESPAHAAEAAKISMLIDKAVARTRDMAAILNPVGPERDGLMRALEELAANVSNVYGITCAFEPEAAVPVGDTAVATHVFRIAQEAVNNAVRHAGPGRVDIELEASGDAVTLVVRDDGAGLPEQWERGGGMGLRAMRHRARVIGGSLSVGEDPGGGTVVKCTFPRGA
jgi:PAS domain S-box-containing protein